MAIKQPDTGSRRPLLDKLGVRPGMRVGLAGFHDQGFISALASRGAVVDPEPSAGNDLIFHLVLQPADLGSLARLRSLIPDAGAIWVLREKGAARVIREEDIITAARAAGLVDNKIASFSESLAAMRLVVPRALRA